MVIVRFIALIVMLYLAIIWDFTPQQTLLMFVMGIFLKD